MFKIPNHETEEVVFAARRHYLFLFISLAIILPVILLAVFDYLLFSSALIHQFFTFFYGILLLLALDFVLYQIVLYHYNLLLVTQKAVFFIEQKGFFQRRIVEISLINIGNVRAHEGGFLGPFFNYGELLIETGGQLPLTFKMDFVAEPVLAAKKIINAHNDLVQRELKGEKIEVHSETVEESLVTDFSAVEENVAEKPPLEMPIKAAEKQRRLAAERGKKPEEQLPPIVIPGGGEEEQEEEEEKKEQK